MSIINWSTVFKPKLVVMCIEVAIHMSIFYYWSKFSSQKKLERCLKDDRCGLELLQDVVWRNMWKGTGIDAILVFHCCVEVWSYDPYVGIIIGPYQRYLLYGRFCWENVNTNSWKNWL